LLLIKFVTLCDSFPSIILLLKLCEFDLHKVLLCDCEFAVCGVWNFLSAYKRNWFIRGLNQFIFLLHLISLAPRFIKVFQIAKTIFKGLNWEKSFKVQFIPFWTQPKTFSILNCFNWMWRVHSWMVHNWGSVYYTTTKFWGSLASWTCLQTKESSL